MEHKPVTLSWENVSVFVKEKKKKKKARADDVELGEMAIPPPVKEGHKQILSDVSGFVQPGSLLAIIGASGAGKSTLMNVLTRRNTKGYVREGEVKVNGVAMKQGIRSISAYVQQDDLFLSTLSVRETLTFRALLRMDQSISRKARLQRVEEVIQEMNLKKCANTRVGKPGTEKGISGGEFRRLTFACEMLTNPPLLFCDEPTSGLDTFMAQNIVQTLQSMAQKNRTVLCTIHQPSSEIFAMFDRVLLLAEGRVAFMGQSMQAMEFLRSQNYSCPANFNPADFYVLTLAIVPGKEAECRKKVHVEKTLGTESRYESSWGQQFRTVFWRSWISLIRDVVLFRVRIVQTVSFPHELGIFMREYGSGLYRSDVYFIAKNLVELPTFVLVAFIFMSIDYWMIGLYDTWQAFLIATAVIIVVANVAASFGLLVSTLAGNVNIALAIAPPLTVPLMMFGGFFLNNHSVPVYFIWLKYLSWYLYSNELLAVNQWQDVTHIECEANTTCLFHTGEDVLRYISFSADNSALNVGLLFALIVAWRLLAFIVLFIRARRSKS